MQKIYSPAEVEQKRYRVWEEAGYFAPSGQGQPYCIMLPPPNVTGTLHMGHAFQITLMDILIRYHRMKGDNTLWQAGTDHAGIATQMVVERQLNQQGKTRQDLGREAFTQAVWKWKINSGGVITQQLRRLGASLDWGSEHFTMDPHFSNAVVQVFVKLYEEGLIYKGKCLVNWDPVLQTALSDLEVVTAEEAGSLWFIRYPSTEGEGSLIVATTRPETLLGDTAVAVHPADPRYQSMIGKTLLLPLTNRRIPVIADEGVDPSFGTGCVKITPAHDFNDYETAMRHNLPLINIFTENACLNTHVPNNYQGLPRSSARQKVLDDLRAHNFLEKEEPYSLKVPRGDRSGAIIEPRLTNQWFVKTKDLALSAIQAVEEGKIRFVPAHWAKTYYEWMNNIKDWCISRQIWWGHRIPAWYDEMGRVYVGQDEAAVREKQGISEKSPLTQDPDVLDTWFSSSLWPFVTLGWPRQTQRLKTFYPTSVLVTGFDIIFFWVARMIMMGLKETGEVPFKEVYITGLLRDSDGRKMSKSRGNMIDPIDFIDGISLDALVAKRTCGLMRPEDAPKIKAKTKEQFPGGIPAHGTDALRFTFAALASTGRDIRFELNRLAGYRNFCNKLWNAARYVKMQQEEPSTAPPFEKGGILKGEGGRLEKFGPADRWILSLLQRTIVSVTRHLHVYRFDLASEALHDFVWHEYCDWYLELSKPILSQAQKMSGWAETQNTLLTVLESILRLLHPFMPFITEEIWQQLGCSRGADFPTLLRAPYPVADLTKINTLAEAKMAWLKAVVLGIRNIRGEMNIAPSKFLPILLRQGTKQDREWTQAHQTDLKALAKIESLVWIGEGEAIPKSATALVGALEILVPMADLIDTKTELARLQKEMTRLQDELARSQTKLANLDFIQKAPPATVQKEQERLQTAKAALLKLEKQFVTIQMLRAK